MKVKQEPKKQETARRKVPLGFEGLKLGGGGVEGVLGTRRSQESEIGGSKIPRSLGNRGLKGGKKVRDFFKPGNGDGSAECVQA